MRVHLSLPALATLALLTSCVGAPRVPPPPPAPVREVAPPPPAAPVPLATDWRDWPQTPGDWRYRSVPGGSVATFGSAPAAFALQCIRDRREVVLVDDVPNGGPATIRTTALSRVVAFSITGDPPGGSVEAHLSASDPLLDAMAFSRGRFTVERPGAPPLVLPAWAEVGRVVQDCRG